MFPQFLIVNLRIPAAGRDEGGAMVESDKLLQRFPSPDGNRWIDLFQNPDGLFYFQEFYEARDNVPVYGAETYRSPGWKSDLYRHAEAAESDLRKMAPWLHEDSN